MSKQVSKELGVKLVELQHVLFDEKIPVMVLFEGPGGEISGKIINNFISLLEPRGVSYHHLDYSMKTKRNKTSYLFSDVPGKGKICIYDRAWYSMMLDSNPTKKSLPVWTDGMNFFERYLMDNGVMVVKFFLNMDLKTYEQRHDEYVGDFRCPVMSDPFSDKNFDVKSEMVQAMFKRTSSLVPWNVIDIDEPKKTMADIINGFITTISNHIRFPYVPSVPSAKEIPKFSNPRDSMDLTKTISEKDYKEKLERLQSQLSKLQCKLASTNKSVVIAFEGWDAAGKGGAIRRITQALNPRGYRAIPIAAPTAEEKSKTHLWRFISRLPDEGEIVIFDRTWYGRMMVEPIEGFCSKDEYERASVEINGFEKQMTEFDTILIKFWIEVSKDEQLLRFNERRLDPIKRWKITDEDWRNREKWDVYEKYINMMMKKTNTPFAPWYVIESNDKRYARIKVLETVVSILKKELKEKGQ